MNLSQMAYVKSRSRPNLPDIIMSEVILHRKRSIQVSIVWWQNRLVKGCFNWLRLIRVPIRQPRKNIYVYCTLAQSTLLWIISLGRVGREGIFRGLLGSLGTISSMPQFRATLKIGHLHVRTLRGQKGGITTRNSHS